MSSNASALKQTVRSLIEDLLEVVPVPPTTTTAGKARAWFGASTGLKPTAVNNWMRQNLTSDSLCSGAAITLTTGNAISYCDGVDEKIDEFMADVRPTDASEAVAYDWMHGDGDQSIDEQVLDWFDGYVIATIIVDI